MTSLPATREAALARLASFTPALGHRYAATRNEDRGPGAPWPENVSKLSPYLRRRLVLEEEVIAAAQGAHGPEAASRFVSEVMWRGYFRGFLEQRPSVWRSYRRDRDDALAALTQDDALAERYAAAIDGRTGIDAFDAWAHELVAHHWLHNHARMWFASIWIFTLRLPWVLGADWFLRNLLDGCPASNTLSWRWVAGLHTRGKAYAARADNIARFTAGRFTARGLVETVTPLEEREDHPLRPFAPRGSPDTTGRFALLLHDEDAHPEGLGLRRAPSLIIGLAPHPDRREVAPAVTSFAGAAIDDAIARARDAWGCPAERATDVADVLRLAAKHGVEPIVTPHVAVGPLADACASAPLTPIVRPYDAALWPLATAGFFKVKSEAPARLRALGLAF